MATSSIASSNTSHSHPKLPTQFSAMASLSSSSSPSIKSSIPFIPLPTIAVSWKSPLIISTEQYERLHLHGYHAGFTNSPFWPQTQHEYNRHRAEWQCQKAEELRAKLEETLLARERKLALREMWEPVIEPSVEGRRGTGIRQEKGKKTKKRRNGGDVVIGECMARIRKAEMKPNTGSTFEGEKDMRDLETRILEVIAEYREELQLRAIRNANTENGLSKVLGLRTQYWKGNEEGLTEGQRVNLLEETRAYWPGIAELKADGDERVKKSGGTLKRRLPIPRFDRLSVARQYHFYEHGLNGVDPLDGTEEKKWKLVAEMCKLTGKDIEAQYQEVAEYEGDLDGLESVKRIYDEDKEEKRVAALVVDKIESVTVPTKITTELKKDQLLRCEESGEERQTQLSSTKTNVDRTASGPSNNARLWNSTPTLSRRCRILASRRQARAADRELTQQGMEGDMILVGQNGQPYYGQSNQQQASQYVNGSELGYIGGEEQYRYDAMYMSQDLGNAGEASGHQRGHGPMDGNSIGNNPIYYYAEGSTTPQQHYNLQYNREENVIDLAQYSYTNDFYAQNQASQHFKNYDNTEDVTLQAVADEDGAEEDLAKRFPNIQITVTDPEQVKEENRIKTEELIDEKKLREKVGWGIILDALDA